MNPFFKKYDAEIRKSNILASMLLAGYLFFGDKISEANKRRNHPLPLGEDTAMIYLVSPPRKAFPLEHVTVVSESLEQSLENSAQNITSSVITSQEMMPSQTLETITAPHPISPASSPISTEKTPSPLPRPAYQPKIINLTELTPATNYQKWKGKRTIDTLVLHTTEGSGNSARNSFLNPSHKYIAHYLVAENGEILQFAEENNVTSHCKDYNQRSIGIEFAGHYNQLITDAQVAAGAHLISSIKAKYDLPLEKIKPHSELDPSRRKDPGKANMDALLKAVKAYQTKEKK